MSCHFPEDSATQFKTAADVCRVCGDDFASKKGKHNLLQGKDFTVRPDYTAALECLTGPVMVGDGLPMAVCESCRTQLKRYHRCAAEVDRIGNAVREKCSGISNIRLKRCVPNTCIWAPIQKQLKSCATQSPNTLSLVSDTAPNTNPTSEKVQVNFAQITTYKKISARVVTNRPALIVLPTLKQKSPADGLVIESSQQTCSAKVCIPTIASAPVLSGPVRSAKRAPTVAELIMKNQQQVEETKETKVILKTLSGVKTRVLRGPFEKIGEDLVQGRYKNLPRSIMAVPGLAYCVTNEVLKLIDRECKKLTSKKFDSVLRQKTPSALADFTWDKVLSEWEKTAPNFLRFLECVSNVSTQSAAKGRHKAMDGTKKYAMAMGGVTLLRVRSREMSAPMYHNSIVMHHGGAKKRCFWRLARLGICVSSRSTLHKLKQMSRSWDSQILEWKRGAHKGSTSDENCAESKAVYASPVKDIVKDNNRETSATEIGFQTVLDAGSLAIQTLLSEPQVTQS
ncbi:hypothetical protein AAFF_G00177480 [Aldrovandia affinis]|uniref:ZAD domain-containing protein n=1 Tax=Aldrovandia affinis TaxID=143900 RepID=A0AAD7RKT5_9TELE|nr:hypothetical protein AAFF_G00177480 [Aldrovandia affinis]